MTDPQKLISPFQRTHWIIKQQTNGLTHADSVLQLPFRGNSMNWILGHIMESRNKVLAALGEPPALAEVQAARYERDSEPVTNEEDAVDFEHLLAAIDDSQERIIAALEKSTTDDLAIIYNEERQITLGDRLEFLHWHETYHVGQLEILRQLAGTDDKII
jgi:uncharacterized damage-inducible protein DinB